MQGEDKAGEKPRSELLKRLVREFDEPKSFQSIYLGPRDQEVAEPYPFLSSIGVERVELSDVARSALEAIEEIASEADSDRDWQDLRWKLSAFLDLQDIFDVVLEPTSEILVFFQQYYFYYESRSILTECLLSGLNGFYIACHSLLRIFVEFTLLQSYYYRIIRDTGSYAPLEQYFSKRKHPSWNAILRKAIPQDAFCKPIRFRVQTHLGGLSESIAHPYHPDLSPIQHRPSPHGHSMEGLFFWQVVRFILDATLWVYYVNFPLLFHPVDVLRKFGLKGPAGIVIDQHCANVIKRSLNEQDYQALLRYSSERDETSSVLGWVASQPDLSDEQIRATWNEENGTWPGLPQAYYFHMAKFRALRMATAFRHSKRRDPPEGFIRATQTYEGWKRLSRRARHREGAL